MLSGVVASTSYPPLSSSAAVPTLDH